MPPKYCCHIRSKILLPYEGFSPTKDFTLPANYLSMALIRCILFPWNMTSFHQLWCFCQNQDSHGHSSVNYGGSIYLAPNAGGVGGEGSCQGPSANYNGPPMQISRSYSAHYGQQLQEQLCSPSSCDSDSLTGPPPPSSTNRSAGARTGH